MTSDHHLLCNVGGNSFKYGATMTIVSKFGIQIVKVLMMNFLQFGMCAIILFESFRGLNDVPGRGM